MYFSARCKAAYLLLVVIFWLTHGAYAAEQQEATAGSEPAIGLDQETQQRLGLKTLELQATQFRPEFIAYGVVQDLQPLLEQRNRYFAAQAAQHVSAAHLQQAQKHLSRLTELYRGKAVAQSKLQEQEAQWQANRAQAGADQYQLAAIRRSTELQWGKTLADLALSEKPGALLAPEAKLLLVALPPEHSLPADTQVIHIERSGNRAQASEAILLSPAPLSDAAVQGETYFFNAAHAQLRVGMRVTCWIAQQRQGLEGVTVPASAVVWHLGQAFVYMQNAEERFERRAIDTSQPIGAGYFVRDRLAPGDKLVTTGAQMLLSEEFRTQIPQEDDD